MNRAQIEQQAGTIVLTGMLRLDTVASLYGRIDFTQLSNQPVTIDLSGVDAVDSAGLALCVDWIKQAQHASAAITFRGVPEQLQRLVRMNGLDDLFAGPNLTTAD